MLYNLFFKHPSDVGETYARHFATALEFGCTMIAAGFACGEGLVTVLGVGFTFLSKAVVQLPF